MTICVDDQGRVIINPATGLPTEDPVVKPYGRTAPLWIVGINPEISWKGLTFTTTLECKGGHYALNTIGSDMSWTGVSKITGTNHRNPFVMPNSVYNDGTGKYVPNRNYVIDNINQFYTGVYNNVYSNFLTSAASWRIREVSLSYDVPAKWLAPLKLVKSASLTLECKEPPAVVALHPMNTPIRISSSSRWNIQCQPHTVSTMHR